VIVKFKHESLFCGPFYNKVLHSIFIKIACPFCFFGTFRNHFKIKLTTHGSILSLRCISMSELVVSKLKKVHHKHIVLELGEFGVANNLIKYCAIHSHPKK
jgi:hypothetical protein